jgi:hypothetical protein
VTVGNRKIRPCCWIPVDRRSGYSIFPHKAADGVAVGGYGLRLSAQSRKCAANMPAIAKKRLTFTT